MLMLFFFCKQKTAYEMRISDWSSDVCSSDLVEALRQLLQLARQFGITGKLQATWRGCAAAGERQLREQAGEGGLHRQIGLRLMPRRPDPQAAIDHRQLQRDGRRLQTQGDTATIERSEEHTSELQSLMRISYDVFCLKKKKNICED